VPIKGVVGKTSYFLALCVDISKTVRDIQPKLLLMTNRKLHMLFRLAPRSMTLDDLELLQVKIFSVTFALIRIFGWTDVCCWRRDCEECKWGVI